MNADMNTDKSIELVICGRGRIGKPLSEKLSRAGESPCYARLHPEKGLCFQSAQGEGDQPTDSVRIGLLIICISAHGRSWHWGEILNGLQYQIRRQQLQVDNLLLVSSTRIYDGYSQGLIDDETQTKPQSVKACQLAMAEEQAVSLANCVRILRPTGLYGEAYPAYQPIMLAAVDKPRFGVTAEQVINRLFQLILSWRENGVVPSGAEVLTDGAVYYQGNKLSFNRDYQAIIDLSLRHRILLGSCTD